MRFLCSIAALAALVVFAPAEAQAQFSLTNYSLVSETRVSRTVSDFEYRATIVNTGSARTFVTATLVSGVPTTQVIRGVLHFANVPANGQSVSTDTFVIRVDRSVAFNLASLQWSYSSAAAPIANAGGPQTKTVGSTVSLSGSNSTNPSGIGTLTYSWAFYSKPPASVAALVNPTSVNPTFTIDAAGTYVVALTVSNGTGSDTAYVTISTVNSAPVANAGANQSVAVSSLVTLNGSASSDVDGNPLTFLWTLVSKPANSSAVLSSTTAMNPTFTADKAGTYVATLVVNDGTVSSLNTASVTVSTTNTAPVANAGPTQSVNVGSLVTLNGSGSTDVDGNPLTYSWILNSAPSGSTAALSNPTSVSPTFTADKSGTYVVQLTVNDGTVNSAPSTVTITTNAVAAPTAIAGNPQTVAHGATVNLNGNGTDPQGRTLTYLWSLTTKPSGSSATLSSTTSRTPSFLADKPGTYVAQLIVNNGFLDSAPSTVTITTTNSTPVANAGTAQSVSPNALVTLNGTGSTDGDNDALTYAWTITSKPSGSTASLTGPTSSQPTFTADLPGSYVIQLIVSDPFTSSAPATVTITAAAPVAITVPSVTNVPLNGTTAFNVVLSTPAPSAGLIVNLTINTPGSATLNLPAIFIAGGSTTPFSQPTVTGVKIGSTTITASGTGYGSGTGTVNTTATVVFGNAPMTIIGTATQNLTLTLSAPASAGGVTVNLSSSAPGVATVPATVTFAQGTSVVNVPVTGVSVGSTTITASAATIAAATASVNVAAALDITTTSLTSGSQGVPYSQTLTAINGTTPYSWSVTGGTLPNGMSLTPAGVLQGTPTTLANATPITIRVTDSSSPAQVKSVTLNLTINAVPPTNIVVTSGSGQSATINTAFAAPLKVTVTGAGGVPAAGVTVTFTAPGSGATGSFAGGNNQATTDANGVATSAVFTANGTVGGPYNVVAQASGLATTVNFSLTNTAVVPTTIAVVSGTPQSATINTAFAAPLKVKVTGAGNAPAANIAVTFTAPGSGASGAFAGGVTVINTDANGEAISPVFTANGTVGGPYNVVAAAAGVASTVNFSLTNTAVVPTTISIVSGTPQSATVNTAFAAPLKVKVTGAGNAPAANIAVTFTAPASGPSGTFAGGVNVVNTDANGEAISPTFTANGTFGPAYNVVASAAGVGSAVNFVLTNASVTPTNISATSGGGQSATINTAFAAPLKVTVTGAGGVPAAGLVVTFAAPGSGASGTFAGGVATATTDANGVATSTVFTANGTVGGPYNVTASVAGLGTTVNFALTNTAVVPTTIAVVSGTPQSATVNTAFAAPLKVKVTGAGNAPAANITVTFTAPGSGASGTFAGSVNTVNTDANGEAISPVFTANATAGGPYNVVASAAGVASTVNFALTNTAVVPTTIAVTSGSGQSATVNTAFAAPLKATVTGAGGAPAAGVTVTFTAPASGPSGTFAGGANTAVTDASGVATSAVFTANGTFGAPYNVVASAAGVASTVNFVLTNTSVAPTNIVVTSGSGQSATVNTAFAAPLKVTVTGAGGVPAAGLVVTFAAPGSGASGTFAGGVATATTDANGVATSAVFTANATAGGPYNVTASVAGLGTTVNFALTNTAVVATTIEVTSGSGQSALTAAAFAQPLVVTVKGAGGAVAPGVTVTFAAPGSGASGTFAGGNNTAVTDANGVATSAVFTANGVAGGPYNVVASAAGVASTVNFVLTNTARPVASLTATGGTPQSATISTAFGSVLTVLAKDSNNNPVPGATITFNPPASGQSATIAGGNVVTTDANGVATSGVVTANATAGAYTITATYPSITAASFSMTNLVGAPATIVATSGSGQSATVSTAYGSVLTATVRDAGNNLVPGAAVTFTAPGSGASATFAGGLTTVTTNTNASGVATSTALTANATAGSFSVVASSGSATTASYSLTNNAVVTGPTITVSSVTVGKNLQAQVTVSLSQPAPAGGLSINITSSDVSKLLVAGRPGDTGTVQLAGVVIPEGLSSIGGIYAQALTDTGSANLVASASGWTNGTGVVTFSPSGFMLTGPGGSGVTTFSAPAGTATTLTVSSVRLTGALAVAEIQQIRGGGSFSVPIASSTPSVGTVPVSSVTLTSSLGGPGSSSTTTTFNSVAVGTSTISLTTPSGFSTPTGGVNALTATVTAQGIIASTVTVGKNLEYQLQLQVNAAPSTDQVVQLVSSDPSKLLFSLSGTDAGASTLNIDLKAGRTVTQAFFVYALTNTGSATYTATSPLYSSATSTVNFGNSGFVVKGQAGVGGNFNLTSAAPNEPLEIYAVLLDGSGIPVETQLVRGGVTASVNVTSGTPAVGTITVSPVQITSGNYVGNTSFDPNSGGSTVISASASGYTTPASGGSLTITVSAPSFTVTGGTTAATIGKNLQIQASIFLAAPAPAGGLTVTLTSNSASLLLSKTPTGAGASSITIDFAAGGAFATYYIQSTSDTGSGTYTASGSGYTPKVGTVNFKPSGFIIGGPGGYNDPNEFNTFFGKAIQVYPAVLEVGTNVPLQIQQIRGGQTVNLTINSSNPAVGAVFPAISITGGSDSTFSTFTTTAIGSTIFTVNPPSGYVAPTGPYGSVTCSVVN